MFEYEGCRWGYGFLEGDPRLSQEELMYILRETVSLYLSGDKKKQVEADNLAGRIKTEYKQGMIGTLSGTIFNVEIYHSGIKGKLNLSFLVKELTMEEKATHIPPPTVH